MAEAERSEQATQRQIDRFREEGKVPQSRELLAALALGAGALALVWAIPSAGEGIREILRFTRESALDGELVSNEVVATGATVMRAVGPAVVGVAAAGALVSVAGGLVLTGFNVAPQAIEPKWERLDVLQSAQNLYFSKQPWVNLVKGLAIAGLLAWAAWATVRAHLDALPALAGMPLQGQLGLIGTMAADLLQRALPAALLIGVADLAWQKYRMSEDMKMTKQQVKEEHKDTDGDPLLKAKRRQRQRQLAAGNMLAQVRKADVVIANPTHYAVALRYRRDESAAPVVLARGVDHLALKIRAEAARHEIAIVENRPLARALYAKSRAGLPIPKEFFAPVAQVLAVVFRQRKREREIAAGR